MFCAKSSQNQISYIKESVVSCKKVLQTENGFIKKVSKMIYHKGFLYILNSMDYKLLVFNSDRFLMQIGKPGQGPGEISLIASFDVDSEYIYILDMPDKMNIFDHGGNFRKSFRLKDYLKKGELRGWTDFFIFNRNIYLSSGINNPEIKKFSVDNGEFLGNLAESKSQVKSGVGSLFKIFNNQIQKKIIVADESQGKLYFYNLFSGKAEAEIGNIDHVVHEEAEAFQKRVNKIKKNSVFSVQLVHLTFSSYNIDKSQVCFLPLVGRKKNFIRYYLIATDKKNIHCVDLELNDIAAEVGKVNNLITVEDNNIFVVDETGDLFLLKLRRL